MDPNFEEDKSLFDYLNSLSPLKNKKCVTTQTLNSLGMDYSLLASPDASIYEDSIFLMRNNTLSTSKPAHEEALNDSALACHYSLEPSSQHTNIELPQAMQYNPCSSGQLPLISTEEANWALELLGMQVPNGTNVQDNSMKDSVECGTYIREVGQVEENIEGADCDYNNLISITQSVNLPPQSTTNGNYKMKNVEHVASSSKHEIEDNPFEPIAASDRNQTRNNLALIDGNPISRGIDELARIRRSITRSCLSHQPEEANWALELLGMKLKVPNGTNVQDGSMKDSVEGGTYIQEVGQLEANIEGADCDYNNLISATQSVNLLPQSTTSNYKMQTVEPIAATDRNQTRNNLANVALRDSNPIVRGVDELAHIMKPYQSYQPEMSSLQRNYYVYTSKSDEMNAIIKENPLLPRKNTSDSQMCVLPRNDFYLNVNPALNNYKGIENEKMSPRGKPESPRCTSSLHFSASQGHHLLPVPAPMERCLVPSETEDFTKSSVYIPGEDFFRSTPDPMSRVQFNDLTNKLLDQNMKRTSQVQSKDSVGLVSSGSEHEMERESADSCQNYATRKRKVKWSDLPGEGRAYRSCRCSKSRCLKIQCECFAFGVNCIGLCWCQNCMNNKSDLTGEGEACKQCRCKTSNCLILNCGCFSAGAYCTGHCSCKGCLNNGDNEDTVLQARRKNDPKVEDGSSFQKRGCVCNKISCQTKKCKCFKDGVGCSPSCKCQGCENKYGRKDSTAETKSELKETGCMNAIHIVNA